MHQQWFGSQDCCCAWKLFHWNVGSSCDAGDPVNPWNHSLELHGIVEYPLSYVAVLYNIYSITQSVNLKNRNDPKHQILSSISIDCHHLGHLGVLFLGYTVRDVWELVASRYTLGLLLIVAMCLHADQNLAAPNLSAIAEEFDLTPLEKDSKLGGQVQLGFLDTGYFSFWSEKSRLFVSWISWMEDL